MAVKIYIDQGHNPTNPNAGAEGNGYREQDIVYEIGVRLGVLLTAAGYEIRLSRPTPEVQLGTSTTTSLMARVNGANSWGADYFISLHTNAAGAASASGTEALVYRAPSRAATLARYILSALTAKTGLRDRGVKERTDLYVLRRTVMPAVLVELGFITNPCDASLMVNAPDAFAVGIANGVMAYFASL